MNCLSCGTENELGRKFCKECGSALALACPSCGAANEPGAKFCGQCGSGLTQSAGTIRPQLNSGSEPTLGDLAAAVGSVGSRQQTERRLVSVVFIDLVGFTSYSEQRDAEDVREMLGRYFEAASDAVRAHGGIVEKFIGDAVMAVWGTPVAHEDDAERAVRAALEIVDRVGALGKSLGVTLLARGGVLSGEAVATVGAVGQGLVAGDLVNSASRLQSAADPGTVLVGEGTYRSASRAIAFAPVEALTVKGKDQPLNAWRALRVVGEVGGFGRGSAPEPPFIGRAEEFRQAKELLHTTSREGRSRLLSLSGVAGVGKSRLIWELQKYTDGLTDPIYWHQGRCPSYGDGVSFWALAEMVRGRAGIAETDDQSVTRERLSDCLANYVSDPEERRWLEPRLGHLLGVVAAPPGDREELFGAWRRFAERIAERGTSVWVFEDIHWADTGLLDFIESLLEWSRNFPILVLTLARPELADRRPDWGSTVRSSTKVHLGRLDDGDIRTLVTEYVEGLPEPGLDRLVARAEGIPLYAVETVRMLADRGVLEQAGSSYRVVGDLGGVLEIPETLHALVAARLDALPEDDRSLLQDASVVGHSFTAQGLAAVAGLDHAGLESRLRVLVRKEFIDQDMDPRSPERGQYRFVQSVIQEVAYSTLSKSARRAKHLACARWFESLADDELAGIVANHYLEAYRAESSAADSEDLADRTREWLGRAADRAFSLGSPRQAVDFAMQAVPLALTAAQRAELLSIAATASGYVGDLDDNWVLAIAAADAFRTADDATGEGRVLASLSRLHYTGDRGVQLERRLLDTEQRLAVGGSLAAHAVVLSAMADAANSQGRTQAGLDYSDRAIAIAQQSGDSDALSSAAFARGWALLNAHRHWEAVLLGRGQLELAAQSGSALVLARSHMGLGIMESEDDPRTALEQFLTCASIAARGGIGPMRVVALSNAAEVAADLGEFDVAQRCLAESAELGVATPMAMQGHVLSQAMLAAFRGELDRASDLLAEAAKNLAPADEDRQVYTWYLRVRAEIQLLSADLAGAYDSALEAVRLEPSGGNSPRSVWATVRAAAGLRDAAGVAAVIELSAGLRGRWVDALRETADAIGLALADDVETAAASFTSAMASWRRLNLPLDQVFAVCCALAVLPAANVDQDELDVALNYAASLPGGGIERYLQAVAARARAVLD